MAWSEKNKSSFIIELIKIIKYIEIIVKYRFFPANEIKIVKTATIREEYFKNADNFTLPIALL
ncbi:hypothetical protein GCM10020331_020750 [Ectobacillus funiculus]